MVDLSPLQTLAVLSPHVHGFLAETVGLMVRISMPISQRKKYAAGPCSANSGTLMFSEIETILETSSAQTVFDEVAAVKYVVWDS